MSSNVISGGTFNGPVAIGDGAIAGESATSAPASQSISRGSTFTEPRSGAPFAMISYAREDETYVRMLEDDLAARGVPTWRDVTTEVGERWRDEIVRRVRGCRVLIVVMSPASDASRWVEREILEAERTPVPIVPLLLAGVPFFRLGDLQYEDVTHRRPPSTRTLDRLRSHLAEK